MPIVIKLPSQRYRNTIFKEMCSRKIHEYFSENINLKCDFLEHDLDILPVRHSKSTTIGQVAYTENYNPPPLDPDERIDEWMIQSSEFMLCILSGLTTA